MSDETGAREALERLERQLGSRGPVAVAISGGVDSMTLAYVAHRVSPGTLMYHALSAAVPAGATERVRHHAEAAGWNLEIIDAGELRDADYVSNPVDRCYFCKSRLYDSIREKTRLPIASGTNADDLSDYRPGLLAASERQVIHPYVDAAIDKAQVRSIARELGLDDLSELPASPCLSSRVTTGIAIDPELLRLIDEVEGEVWRKVDGAVSGVRCRIRENQVTIEIEMADGRSDIERLAGPAIDGALEVMERLGLRERFAQVTAEPYRRGSAFLIESVQVD